MAGDIEADGHPLQVVSPGPIPEFVEANCGLRGIAGIYVVALIPGQHDPGDGGNAIIIQPAYNLRSGGTEIGNGNPEARMKIFQVREVGGSREN